MTQNAFTTIILAAGMGTRMRSGLPKVLHPIAGRPMIGHVLELGRQAGASVQAVVVGHGADEVRQSVIAGYPETRIFIQEKQLGTAHALLSAREVLDAATGYVIVLYGDTPLLEAPTVRKLLETLDAGADIVVLGFESASPEGYGRLLTGQNGQLLAIREEKDATTEEKQITLCNSGVYGFRSQHLPGLLDRIGNNNARGEYYLTDAVEIAVADGLSVKALACNEEEVLGINDRVQLSEAEKLFQSRMRRRFMEQGVTLQAPETVYFSHDTRLGRDVIVEPHVYFAPGVIVEDEVHIRGFSYFEQSIIRRGAVVGPYARMRPEADIGENARIGNFVEVKKSVIEAGAKVNHLSYIGDARVGAGANIGAGTIICNYDGFLKHKTDIGSNAFVGSNSSLVAPVRIGDGAYIGSGSVITRDVPGDALGLSRAEQIEREDWASGYRLKKLEEKESRKK